jgi:multiple sugar transport system ATP-binding protein
MAPIVLDSVSLVLGDSLILDRVSLDIGDGELMGIIGPSGSGKTSILRVIAGLHPVESGSIMIGGVDMTTTPTRRRGVVMAFQDAALYPRMTAERNVGYPLELREVDGSEIGQRVSAAGRAFEIEEILDRLPHQLSAGHQQLVQVARTMIRAPAVFLLDEPLAWVDAGARTRVRRWLRSLQTGYRVTTVYVTNEASEAMAIADRLAVLGEGRIQQIGEPKAIYGRPANRLVAECVGERPMNFVPVQIEVDGSGSWLVADGMRVRSWAPEVAAHHPRQATLGIRSEDIEVDPAGEVKATALGSLRYGHHRETELAIGSARVWMSGTGSPPAEGDALRVRFVRWHLFITDGGTAITHFG